MSTAEPTIFVGTMDHFQTNAVWSMWQIRINTFSKLPHYKIELIYLT
jgi:hypothetical protein